MPVQPQKISPKNIKRNRRLRRQSNLWMALAVGCFGTLVFFQNCARDRFQSTSVSSSFVTQTPDMVHAQQITLDSAKQKTIEVISASTPETEVATEEVLKMAEQNEIDALHDEVCDLRTKPMGIEFVKCPHSNDYQNRRDYKVFCGPDGAWKRVLIGTDISSCMASYCDPNLKPLEVEKAACPAPNGNFKWATQTYTTSCVGSKWSRSKSTYDAGKCPLPKPRLRYSLNLAYPGANGEQLGFDLYYPSDYQLKKYPIFVWVHGNNWRSGDKSNDTFVAKAVAEMGYIVFNLNYRLVRPAMASTNFPASVDDINAFFTYLSKNLSSVNADRSTPITIGGSAAGAHLALSQSVRTPAPINFRCVMSFSAPVDLTPDPTYWVLGTIDGTLNFFFNGDRSKLASYHQRKEGSPIFRMNSFNAKDILIVHAYDDNIVPFDQALRLESALKKRGGVQIKTIYWNEGQRPVFEMSQASHGISNEQLIATIQSYLQGSRCR